MEQGEREELNRVVDHEAKGHFPPGAVRRAVLLRHGDEQGIEAGYLLLRVFVEVPDEQGLAVWRDTHRAEVDELRRDLSRRLPSARLLELTFDEPGAPRISVPDDGSLTTERLSGREIVTKALALVRANYVFPELAEQGATAIEARLAAGEYDQLDEITLTELVTRHLQEATGDRHLAVMLGDVPPPNPRPGPRPWEPKDYEARQLARRQRFRWDNFGIRRVERLDGNVGYLDLRRMPDPANAGPAIAAATELVAGTYALIIDMRRNGGGAPEGVVVVQPPGRRAAHSLHRHRVRRHRGDQAVLVPPLRAGQPLPRSAGVRADQPPDVLGRGGPVLRAAGAGPGGADRRDDRRGRPPDPGIPGQHRGVHRHTIRALGEPGHRSGLAASHRRGAGHRGAGNRGVRRRLHKGAAARAGPGRRDAADHARGPRRAGRAACLGYGVTCSPSGGPGSRGRPDSCGSWGFT